MFIQNSLRLLAKCSCFSKETISSCIVGSNNINLNALYVPALQFNLSCHVSDLQV